MAKQIIEFVDGDRLELNVSHGDRLRAEMDVARMGFTPSALSVGWMTRASYYAAKRIGESRKFDEWADRINEIEAVEDDAPHPSQETLEQPSPSPYG